MKKTMFITSVIMVVVLAIALTTSSLAWFTAGGADRVSVNALTVSAIDAGAVGAGLEISKNGTTSWGTQNISLIGIKMDGAQQNPRSYMSPLCPASLTTYTNEGGVITITGVTHEQLYSGINNMFSNKTLWDPTHSFLQFSNDVAAGGVPGNANGSGSPKYYKDNFFLRNSGSQSDITAACTASVSVSSASASNTNSKLWVAVFWLEAIDDESGKHPGDDEYVETFAHHLVALSSNTATGMTYIYDLTDNEPETPNSIPDLIDKDHRADVIQNKLPTTAVASFVPVALPKGGISETDHLFHEGSAVEVEVFAWFDGADLDVNNTDTVISVSLQFDKQV